MTPELFSPRQRDLILLIIRTLIAAWLALYISLRLELDNPSWAVLAVLIVTLQPVVISGGTPPIGTLLGRGRARLFGTLMGACVGLLLVALFSQQPLLYLLAAGGWLSLCSFIVIMLKEEHLTYFMMLSGYTATLVSLSAIGSGITEVWEIAVSRFSETAVGTLTGLMVHLVIAPRFSTHQLPDSLGDLLVSAEGEVSVLLDGQSRLFDRDRLNRILANFQRFETLRRLTQRETRRYRILMPALKQFGTEALSLATNMNELRRLIRQMLRMDNGPQLIDVLRPIAKEELALQINREWTGPVNPHAVAQRLKIELQEHSDFSPDLKALALPAAERLDEVIVILRRGWFLRDAFERPHLMDGLEVDEQLQSRAFHNEFQVARYNALRIFLAFELAGLFWLYSGWQHGHMALLLMGIFTVLFAKGTDPAAVVAQVLKGTLVATLISAILVYFVMPIINGMVLLALVLTPPIIFVTLLARRSGTSVAALTGTITMMSLLHLESSYALDPILFANQAIAAVIGTMGARITFSLLRQPRNDDRREQLMRSAWRELALQLIRRRVEPRHFVETRMYDRLAQLIALGATDAQLREMLELNTMTLAIWRIRRHGMRLGRNREKVQEWMTLFSSQLRPGSQRASPLWGALADDARIWAEKLRPQRRGGQVASEFVVLSQLLKTMMELGPEEMPVNEVAQTTLPLEVANA